MAKNHKKTGSKPVVLGGADNFPRRDTGSKPAKRQTQRTHGDTQKGRGRGSSGQGHKKK